MHDAAKHEPAPYPSSEPEVGAAFLRRHGERVWAGLVFLATLGATVAMMPPARYPELAYVFAAPAVFWAFRAPGWRLFLWTIFAAQALAWTITLGWLRHVTVGGLLLLGPVVGAWVGSWFAAVRWTMPRMKGRPWWQRVLMVLGLAGAWVVVEWTRTWLLSGFPWLTLSATQWERLSVLQPAAYTGAWGVSFVLIAVNVASASYAWKLLGNEEREEAEATGVGPSSGEPRGIFGARSRCPEFLAAMVLLLGCLLLTARETFNRGRFHRPWAQVGIVQPAIPQVVKWDPAEAGEILRTLEAETLRVAAARPDLLLWPEATTPLAAKGDPGMQEWTEQLVRRAGAPLLFGSVAFEGQGGEGDRWWNGVFLATPEGGMAGPFYAKRHLVPFGEYVPLRPVLGWLEKVVPVGGDFARGEGAGLIELPLGRGWAERENATRVGPLICYEDIFPRLARESVRAGAEVLVVNTNNGWFGEGAAAYQHAAHSVLRAVETRRPVLRAGNSGWSGWIDECGAVRAVLTRGPDGGEVRTAPAERGARAEDAGTIYFRGGATLEVTRDARFLGVQSFYVRWGDWFVAVSAAFALAAWALLRRPRAAAPGASPARRGFRA
jgi:apolipoprotein N-acyltransferase